MDRDAVKVDLLVEEKEQIRARMTELNRIVKKAVQERMMLGARTRMIDRILGELAAKELKQ